MRVCGVVATGVSKGVGGTKPRQCVDMCIGVVTAQIRLVNPEYPLRTEILLQGVFNGGLAQLAVTVGVEQTLLSGHQRTCAITLHAAAFQNKINRLARQALERRALQ